MTTVVQDELEAFLPHFGLSDFRPGQREVIEAVLAGEDCLCLMPTGGGKSLCYQLPSIAREGVTLVISPLIALMKDQVDSLTERGLRATFINSTLQPGEQQERLSAMAAGQYDLVYVVPERFRSPRFLRAVEQSNIQLLAVDEAHCISEWGHDFRPDYARLGEFRQKIGNPTTIALTATATQEVREDIERLLHLRDAKKFITGFSRPNLRYEAGTPSSAHDKDELLLEFLDSTPGSGIVYASTRKRCEEVAETIQRQANRKTLVYHAGLAPDDRRRAQEIFMAGQVDVVVATNAFGMGIDKSDVRFVVHYTIPGTPEAYYQEAGRAGRDGQPSRCLLLYHQSDRYIQEFFIDSAHPKRQAVRQVYNLLRGLKDDPIEITQDQIKESLNLGITSDGVGQCEQLLEKAGALKRLDARQNMGVVSLRSDLPTLVDLLPRQAKVQRRVLQAIEKLVGKRRHQEVYFHREDLAAMAEVDTSGLKRAMVQLRSLEAFDYIPPFRGRAIHMITPELPLEDLGIDFEQIERRRAAAYAKLDWVCQFARGRRCREQALLRYFGEDAEQTCGHCDHCEARPAPQAQVPRNPQQEQAVLEVVRKVLSGVARTQGRFGRTLVAQMLCGSKASNILKFRLDQLSTYGLLSELKQNDVVQLLDQLIEAECIDQSSIDPGRPLIRLSALGDSVMRGQAGLEFPIQLPGALRQPSSTTTGALPETDLAVDQDLLQALKAWRKDQAEQHKLPPHYVFPNSTLDELAALRPESRESLLEIKGIGEKKLDRYGEDLLAVLTGKTPEVESVEPSDTRPSPTPEPLAEPEPMFESEENPTELSSSESPQNGQVRPDYYWTVRLLEKGFSATECASIRGLADETILDHALRATEAGQAIALDRLLSVEQIAAMRGLIGWATPSQIQPLIEHLPSGTRREHVWLYLRCRSGGESSNSEA